jgi:hypothetical protein
VPGCMHAAEAAPTRTPARRPVCFTGSCVRPPVPVSPSASTNTRDVLSGRAAVVTLGSIKPNDFFVISTTSTTHYANDSISLIELDPLILIASSATGRPRVGDHPASLPRRAVAGRAPAISSGVVRPPARCGAASLTLPRLLE